MKKVRHSRAAWSKGLKGKIPKAESELELRLRSQISESEYIKSIGLEWLHDKPFMGERDFRFDFQFPDLMFAIECQGGIYSPHMSHSKGGGIEQDHEKCGHAVELGWTIYYTDLRAIKSERAINVIESTIKLMISKRHD